MLALRQTAGRGAGRPALERRRRAISPSPCCSAPRHPAREAPQWGLLGGVALAEAARAVDPEPDAFALRWPNDLLRHGAKCAGLLAESAVTPEGGLAWLVLGFGVNLAHAPDVPDRATARLGRVARRPRPSPPACSTACPSGGSVQAAEGFGPIRAAWEAHGPARGQRIAVRCGPGTDEGGFAGLADDGSLLLETDRGRPPHRQRRGAGAVPRPEGGGALRAMLLAVDAGNTNVVFAVHDGREWRGRWRIATRADRTSDEYAVWLLALFQHCGLKAADDRPLRHRHGGARRALQPPPPVAANGSMSSR